MKQIQRTAMEAMHCVGLKISHQNLESYNIYVSGIVTHIRGEVGRKVCIVLANVNARPAMSSHIGINHCLFFHSLTKNDDKVNC